MEPFANNGSWGRTYRKLLEKSRAHEDEILETAAAYFRTDIADPDDSDERFPDE